MRRRAVNEIKAIDARFAELDFAVLLRSLEHSKSYVGELLSEDKIRSAIDDDLDAQMQEVSRLTSQWRSYAISTTLRLGAGQLGRGSSLDTRTDEMQELSLRTTELSMRLGPVEDLILTLLDSLVTVEDAKERAELTDYINSHKRTFDATRSSLESLVNQMVAVLQQGYSRGLSKWTNRLWLLTALLIGITTGFGVASIFHL